MCIGYKTNSWITDESCTTYFEILTILILGNSGSTYLMNPSITNALKILYDYTEYIDPWSLGERLLIMATNDCIDLEKGGGSHWPKICTMLR